MAKAINGEVYHPRTTTELHTMMMLHYQAANTVPELVIVAQAAGLVDTVGALTGEGLSRAVWRMVQSGVVRTDRTPGNRKTKQLSLHPAAARYCQLYCKAVTRWRQGD